MTTEAFTWFPPNIDVCWCSSVVISKIFVFSDVNLLRNSFQMGGLTTTYIILYSVKLIFLFHLFQGHVQNTFTLYVFG